MKDNRLNHIDLIEFIAIFFVIIYHSTIYSFNFITEKTFINYMSYFFRTILSTCVPLFFFANGYLLFNREYDFKKHVKKIIKLIILTFVWSGVLMPLYVAISGETLSIKEIISKILYNDIDWNMNIFWFMGELVCIYLLFPALKSLFDSDKKSFVFFTIVVFLLTFGLIIGNQTLKILGFVFHCSLGRLDYPRITMFNPFNKYGYAFVYFCFGGLIYTYEDKIRAFSKIKRNIISVVGIIVSCFLLFIIGLIKTHGANGNVWDVVWNGYDTIFTFFNLIFIYVLSLSYDKDIKFVKNVSCNTLGIYFIHKFFIRLTRPFIMSYGFLCNIPFNILYAFLIMCVCLLICLCFRKIPLLKKLI